MGDAFREVWGEVGRRVLCPAVVERGAHEPWIDEQDGVTGFEDEAGVSDGGQTGGAAGLDWDCTVGRSVVVSEVERRLHGDQA